MVQISAGVAILRGNFRDKILHNESNNNGMWLKTILQDSHKQYIIANIYGTNCKSTKLILLHELEIRILDLSTKYINAKCILRGDFIVVPDSSIDVLPKV